MKVYCLLLKTEHINNNKIINNFMNALQKRWYII